ncbi:9207_t:CDS:1 [Gigaspora margarita]|uniref:9207_t:CDS:1 n=1 Tax=Gigaspora margarita TaxID=4874 RepID=A0ABM8W1I4_GIGMA|nr:9207_t:CDS:1 [Gigaspora margarita]
MLPGSQHTYFSANNAVIEEVADNNNIYPIEFLNTFNPSGILLSNLILKVGCPIILLRNIASGQGPCNSTCLVVTYLADYIIEARILYCNHTGKLIFISCITLNPSTSEFSFIFKRRQFHICVAFGITINKLQGQSVKYVGLDL